mgnify:CR=1 FL=1
MEIRQNFDSEDEDNQVCENNYENLEQEENESDNEVTDESEYNIGNEYQIKYNPNDFQITDIIKKLMELKIIRAKNKCDACNNEMKLVSNKGFKDQCCWRCKKNTPFKHDKKINIRSFSILNLMRSDIRILYFIIIYNFPKNISINSIYKNCLEFSKDLKLEFISKKHISKIIAIISNKIMEITYYYWNENKMGMEPGLDGKSRIEIDESKVVTFGNTVRWIFDLVDRGKYDIRIFFINDNRTRETILPLIKKNVYKPFALINDNKDLDTNYPSTRIYSDYFATYQTQDFNNMGFILYKVNHSFWFGEVKFHTNTIEGIWSQIKRITNYFMGLNGTIFNKFHNIDNFNDYINSIICTALFYMRCEHDALGDNAKIDLLKKYIIHN